MRLWPFLLAALPLTTGAQLPESARRAPLAAVSGIVTDSVTRKPLRGALVQLVSSDRLGRFGRSVQADSAGRYVVDSVPDGQYNIGFLHPVLDSLGLEPIVHALTIANGQPAHVDLSTPSARRLRAAFCPRGASGDSATAVIGVLRSARDGSAVANANVSAEWLDFTFGVGTMTRHLEHISAKTHDNGWFVLCDVPAPGTLAMTASLAADSTDRVQVDIPQEGFMRRELYLGTERIVATRDTVRADSLHRPVTRTGDGRLTGTVVAAEGKKPIAGAQVGIVNGPHVRADDRGEWTLLNVPSGTRMLEVRAISYFPQRRPVDVIADAPPVSLAMTTLKAMLDTIHIVASGRFDRSGFLERQRSGAGRYVTAKDIMRYNPFSVVEIFRHTPGVRIDRSEFGGSKLSMPGTFTSRCSPAIFLNGMYLSDTLDGLDIDTVARPEDIAGIEIYTDATVPPQFSAKAVMSDGTSNAGGCGSILIWTKR